MGEVPQMHQDLLQQEIDGLKDADFRYVWDSYDKRRNGFQKGGGKIADQLLDDVEELHRLLEHREELTEEQRRIATAGLKYFLKDTDLIPDQFHGSTGLVDDAFVVRAALERLGKASG